MSYVMRHGRRIEIVDTEPVATPKRRRTPKDRYVQLTEEGAKVGFQALGCTAALVWFEILYRAWSTKRLTIELPNKKLAGMGVSKWAKRRALCRLERAGLIEVDQPDRKSPTITLRGPADEWVRIRTR